LTATAITEISSPACLPTTDPPRTTPVAGSLTIFTKPFVWLSMSAFGEAENGTLVTRTFRPSANGLCVGDIVDSLLVHPSLSEALAEAAE
jgi:hypothetical protein